MLLAFCLLYKISKFGAFKELNVQYQSMELACRLAVSLFEVDGRHPQNLIGHARYRTHRLLSKVSFLDETIVNLGELLSALEYFIWRAMDAGESMNSLPLLTLFEHIATDIAKDT